MSTVHDIRPLTGPDAGAAPGTDDHHTTDPQTAARQRAEELQQRLIAQVEAMTTNGQWLDWVRFSRRISRQLSMANQLLVWTQDPDATHVLGFHSWRAQGRWVRKGEKAIKIWAGLTRRREDPDDDERTLAGFRLVSVFDVRQTDGRDLPEPPMPELLTGDAPTALWERLAGIVTDAGFTLERGSCAPANGWTNFLTRTVRVRDDVDAAQAVKTLAHEVAHLCLDDPALHIEASCRGHREVRAETFAAIVCELAGLPTATYSVPYVAHWLRDLITEDRDIISVLTEHTKIVVGLVDLVMAPLLADTTGRTGTH